jgi:hypothetical protein
MKPVLYTFLITASLLSCKSKDVDLSTIDIFTAGNSKEWNIVENYFSGTNVVEIEPCFADDTAVFSKGERTGEKREPKYTWKKNRNKCSSDDPDFELYYFIDGKTIIFFSGDLSQGDGDTWQIDLATKEEIILSQSKGTPEERRLHFVYKNATEPE